MDLKYYSDLKRYEDLIVLLISLIITGIIASVLYEFYSEMIVYYGISVLIIQIFIIWAIIKTILIMIREKKENKGGVK